MGSCSSSETEVSGYRRGANANGQNHPLAVPFSPELHATPAPNASFTRASKSDAQINRLIEAVGDEGSERSAANGVYAREPPLAHTQKLIGRIVSFARSRHGVTGDVHQYVAAPPPALDIAESVAVCEEWLRGVHAALEAAEPERRKQREKYFASMSDDSAYAASNDTSNGSRGSETLAASPGAFPAYRVDTHHRD